MDRSSGAGANRALRRRDFLKLAAVAGGTGVLVACQRELDRGGEPAPADVDRPSIEEESGDLQVFTWSGYETRALWRGYAREFSEPNFTFMTSSDHALSRIGAGFRADVVHPCNAYIMNFADLGAFQPWDTSLLSNFSALVPALVQAGQIDGEQYFLPFDWGFDAPMYNADHVEPEGEVSWALLYDERYAGKISWYDHTDNLVINGWVHGFEDPYDMSDEELDIVREDLIEKKQVVRTFWGSPTDMLQDFAAGNVWISYAWPDAWVATTAEGVNAVYPEPKEGRMAWLCGLMLMRDTENYHHAHEFADALISSSTAEWLLTNWAYGHANAEADFSEVDPAVIEAFSLDDVTVLEEPRTHIDRHIPRRDLYQRIWDEVKAA
jgi:spermidine/putrescine transport system substrate-binding protein